jgi:hypothetical protein
MDHGCQLEWIQKNRSRRPRTRLAGVWVERLARKADSNELLSPIAEAVADLVDEEFRTHCRLADIRAGTLVVQVDRASLVYPMRLHWLRPLSRRLRERAATRRIGRISFEFGNAGVCVPEPVLGSA